ncbi:hypothetical protein [uncultured Sunxiuqinia sp.]|uniref:hypothetical protein n=1 Tax=uncultured Sunxiuqinia sp. TaxID=1573825 RepID=UPI002639D814|nr:hypothetical protein [uncultured Sunxiuqinia sp.]
MKKTMLIVLLGMASFLLNPETTQAQVTVEHKPSPPKVKLPLPEKPGPDYQLIPGHWIWHRPSKMYVWVGPHWVLPKENRKWSPGHWQKQKKGWKWIPGKWKKINKRKYFFN